MYYIFYFGGMALENFISECSAHQVSLPRRHEAVKQSTHAPRTVSVMVIDANGMQAAPAYHSAIIVLQNKTTEVSFRYLKGELNHELLMLLSRENYEIKYI